MLHELCITLTMRAISLGHSLYEAQYLAAIALLQLVLLFTLLGYRMDRPDETGWLSYRAVVVRACGVLSGIRGILPIDAGTIGRSSAALLQE